MQECGTACPAACGSIGPRPCTLQCVSGCFCNDGYVLLDSTQPDGPCVARNQCPGSGRDLHEGSPSLLSPPPPLLLHFRPPNLCSTPAVRTEPSGGSKCASPNSPSAPPPPASARPILCFLSFHSSRPFSRALKDECGSPSFPPCRVQERERGVRNQVTRTVRAGRCSWSAGRTSIWTPAGVPATGPARMSRMG